MLDRLKINNFALIDDIELEFDSGMTVLTGETGAGKSVIVAALNLVLGGRADREHIRHGATIATVEAQFSVDKMSKSYRELFADHIFNNNFTILRQISVDGTSRVKINGKHATVTLLKKMASPLAEILGQYANRMLLDEENHLLFLDSFASLAEQREEVTEQFKHWESIRAELQQVRTRHDELVKERELLLFQWEEIRDAEIREGEEEEILQERRILDSSQTLIEAAGNIETTLDADPNSIMDKFRSVHKELDRMAAIDKKITPQVEQAADIDYKLEELRQFIQQYGAAVPDNPKRLEEINHRLDEIYNLKMKYGDSESAILKTLARIEKKLDDKPDIDSLIGELGKKETDCRESYSSKAIQLSEVRQKAANYLEKLVIKELSELAIESAQFQFNFVRIEIDDDNGIMLGQKKVKPTAYGLETGSFLFSANVGEPMKSLSKTASGGEISRVLLALKAAEKKNLQVIQSMMVFDEVDSGIGGQTAVDMGKKLKKLSENSQLLVITHLHQIARLADHHMLAEKSGGRDGRTIVKVVKLDKPAITKELTRMVALPE